MHGNIDIANFADDNTHCTSANYRDNVVESLKQASVSLSMVQIKLFKN